MIASTIALQQAIFATLTHHPQLLALLGGPRVYDDTPQPVVFPYMRLFQSSVR